MDEVSVDGEDQLAHARLLGAFRLSFHKRFFESFWGSQPEERLAEAVDRAIRELEWWLVHRPKFLTRISLPNGLTDHLSDEDAVRVATRLSGLSRYRIRVDFFKGEFVIERGDPPGAAMSLAYS